MTCPHCGHSIETSQAKWQRQRLAHGDCCGCGGPKEHPKAWRCRACQRKLNARQRRRYQLRKTVRGIPQGDAAEDQDKAGSPPRVPLTDEG